MTPVEIEPATPADAPAIAAVFRAARLDAMPWLPRLHDEAEDRAFFVERVMPACEVHVTRRNGQPVAFIAVSDDVIEHLYVRPDAQRSGLGSALLDDAKARRPGGLRLWVFRRNQAAVDFYAQHGFAEVMHTDGSDNEEREPDVLLAWPGSAAGPGRDWHLDGVRVVRAGELDPNTPQTPGMNRAAAITTARGGAEKLWAGTVVIHPDAKTGAHHHGPVESVIYVVRGQARMRWGNRLEFTAEAGPGDFIYVPPFVPHQEINANADDELSCVIVRSGQEPVVVNLDLPDVESNPEAVQWVDDIHGVP